MNIKLKQLLFKNFKGIKELSIDFGKTTNISGENATGKTSVFDAFTWLLFDKDSQDRVVGDKESNFQIKTYDNTGEILHGLEHTVTGTLDIDDRVIVLSKTYKEKWTKKKGEAERQLTGHETLYFINDVPVKQSEYKSKIGDLIDEDLFKLISNPTYFSMNLKWQDRRKIILKIIGDITSEDVITENQELNELVNDLKDDDIDTFKKSIAARKKRLNDEIKSIPFRIDECNNSISDINFGLLQTRKETITSSIKALEDELLDISKVNDKYLNEKSKLYEYKDKLKTIEYKAKSDAQFPIKGLYEELNTVESEITKNESTASRLKNNIQNMNSDIAIIDTQLQEMRDKWNLVNNESLTIPEDEFICPTCRRSFEASDIESKKQELQENFNQNKSKKLSEINSSGKAKTAKQKELILELDKSNKDLEIYNSRLDESYNTKADLQEKIKNFNPEVNLDGNKEYQNIKSIISQLEITLEQKNDNNQTNNIRERKNNLENDLEKINKDLGLKEQNEKLKTRIKELEEHESKLAQQIAELEGKEYLCDKFIKTKVQMLEGIINQKFKQVSFKLFNTLVNGAVEECCEALINGVPFSNANTAAQVNAGLDIINALCNNYEVEAPIFIDNRESINEIIDTDSQIINLVVSKDSKLKISNIESEVA